MALTWKKLREEDELKDLPDMKAYAEALATSPEVLEKLTRRRFVAGYEREEGQVT
jgi:hypothetical protein